MRIEINKHFCELDDENNERNVEYSDNSHWILEKNKNSSNNWNKEILCDILDKTLCVLDIYCG